MLVQFDIVYARTSQDWNNFQKDTTSANNMQLISTSNQSYKKSTNSCLSCQSSTMSSMTHFTVVGIPSPKTPKITAAINPHRTKISARMAKRMTRKVELKRSTPSMRRSAESREYLVQYAPANIYANLTIRLHCVHHARCSFGNLFSAASTSL